MSSSLQQEITRMLLEDHNRMCGLSSLLEESLHQICHNQNTSNLQQAQKALHELLKLLTMHAVCEEKALFPALGKYHSTVALEAEHGEILLKRAAILAGLKEPFFAEVCTGEVYQSYVKFVRLLNKHLAYEESNIFPLMHSLPEKELMDVLSKIKNIRSKDEVHTGIQ